MTNLFNNIIVHRLLIALLCFTFACGENKKKAPSQEEDKSGRQENPAPRRFVLHDPEMIDTYNDIDFYEGGFSGLCHIPGTDMEFYAVTDRGPNLGADRLTEVDDSKLLPFPDYAPKIVRLKASNDTLRILSSVSLKNPEGKSITGVAPEGSHLEAMYDGDKQELSPGEWGMDVEGIAIGPDGEVWICEEYRPSISRVDPETGRIIERFTPQPQHDTDMALDSLLEKRRKNRGFEGITVSEEGVVYAIMQSPLNHPDEKQAKNSRMLRIIALDPQSGLMHYYFYEMEAAYDDLKQKDMKAGGLSCAADGKLLVLEHAQRGKTDMKRIYEVDIKSTEPLIPDTLEPSPEALKTAKDVAGEYNVKALKKELVTDLSTLGWDPAWEKAEGLTRVNDTTIAVINDNDYGVETNEKGSGVPEETGVESFLWLINTATKSADAL